MPRLRSWRWSTALNWLGTLVLIAGICGFVLIHQHEGTQESGITDQDGYEDSSIPPEDSKNALRSVEGLWGKLGTLGMRLSTPPSKAVVVLLLSMGIACGCFYAAHALKAESVETPGDNQPPNGS